MRKYYGITTPVWIFLFTLLLVVITGGIVGTSPCERTVRNCEATAQRAHTNNLTLQQAYISRCSEEACKSGKSSAALPFSILVLGAVLYIVWLRQGDSGDRDSSPAARSATTQGAAPAASGTPATSKAPAQPTSASAASSAPPSAPPSAPEGKRKAATEPGAKSAPKTSFSPGEKAVYFDALKLNAEQPKEDLAQGLCRLTGVADADLWKGAPADDLALLNRSIATAALLSPAGSKYRNRTGAGSTGKEALDAMTKKALHQQCVTALRADLKSLAGADAYPQELSKTTVRDTIASLDEEGALAGLSRLSKAGLITLAAFLSSA
jgi:hypothetical protein